MYDHQLKTFHIMSSVSLGAVKATAKRQQRKGAAYISTSNSNHWLEAAAQTQAFIAKVAKVENRCANLLRGFLRGAPYLTIEQSYRENNEPDWDAVADLATSFHYHVSPADLMGWASEVPATE